MSTVHTLNVFRDGLRVGWAFNGLRVADFAWQAALDIAKALRRHADAAETLSVEPETTFGPLSVRSDGDMVLIVNRSALAIDMPADTARELWTATAGKAREAEELANADHVAMDAAILHRSGAPFGLAHAPAIRKEAAKLAQHDEKLRRYMKDGIKSAEVVPAPTISHETRTPDARLRALMRRMSPADKSKLIATLKGHHQELAQ